MTNKKIAVIFLGMIVLVAAAAGGAAYLTKESMTTGTAPKTTASSGTPWRDGAPVRQAPVQQAQQPPCTDHNVLGMAAGAIAGGVAGHQLGKGEGNTAATIGGAAGGAYLGQQYIPLKNVACR